MVLDAIDFYGMSQEDVLKYLPMKDCGRCGKSNCDEFAASLSAGTSKLEECPEMEDVMRITLGGALSIRLEVREADERMIAVPEPIIPINNPTEESPVFVTGNSAVTIWVLKLIFDKTPDVSAWFLPTDSKGFTVDHIMQMDLMTPFAVAKAIAASGIGSKVDSRVLILPGLCEGLEKKIEMITKWKVVVGPRSGFELPAYIMKLKAGD
jgi:acetyl-CoA decarbonylase/synthase complex subunit gamma